MKNKIIYIVIGVIAVVALFIVSWRLITIPSFADITWVRKTRSDTENIYFGSDGEFAYWCNCGDPVDGSDVVEYYKYNVFTKKIKLVWHDINDKKVEDVYEVIKVDKDKLVLRINGKRCDFTLE